MNSGKSDGVVILHYLEIGGWRFCGGHINLCLIDVSMIPIRLVVGVRWFRYG